MRKPLRGSGAGMRDEPLVLGIETSCDETGVGIVRGETLLADAVASSVDEHARFGGVVPEVASRAHLEAMVPTIERACREAGVAPAPTSTRSRSPRDRASPGRCWSAWPRPRRSPSPSAVPLYGVNHLAAHVAVDVVEHGPLPEPTLALLVSGGHSSLLLVPDVTARRAAAGRDDRRRGGGGVRQGGAGARAALPRRARTSTGPRASGDQVAIDFPRGLTAGRDLERHRFDFSFSGLKTAVARWVQAARARGRGRCRSPTSPRASRRRSSTC